MADDTPPFSLADILPSNRREIMILVAGASLAFGLSALPGITFEPEELSACKVNVATQKVTIAAQSNAAERMQEQLEDTEERVGRCWERFRSLRAAGLPPALEMELDPPGATLQLPTSNTPHTDWER